MNISRMSVCMHSPLHGGSEMWFGELVAHVIVCLVESQPELRGFESVLPVLGSVLPLLDGGNVARRRLLHVQT